jgi:hypothetical protein
MCLIGFGFSLCAVPSYQVLLAAPVMIHGFCVGTGFSIDYMQVMSALHTSYVTFFYYFWTISFLWP